jgi:hypothetical protein
MERVILDKTSKREILWLLYLTSSSSFPSRRKWSIRMILISTTTRQWGGIQRWLVLVVPRQK